jgi:hypothetical protein
MLAGMLLVIVSMLTLVVIAPPTVDAASWQDRVIAGAAGGAVGGAIVGTFVPIPGVGTGVGALVGLVAGATAGAISFIVFDWGQSTDNSNAQSLARYAAWNVRNSTADMLTLAYVNAGNIGELGQRSINYYERSAYNSALKLYQEQTNAGTIHVYDGSYVLDHSLAADEISASVAGTYFTENRVLQRLDTLSASYIGDYQKNSEMVAVNYYRSYDNSNIRAASNYAISTFDTQYLTRVTSFCNTPAGTHVWLNNTDTIVAWNLGVSTEEGSIVMTDTEGVTVYSQPVSCESGHGVGIDLSTLDLKSGRYNVALPSAKWVWSASAVEDYSNSGTVAPGVAVYTVKDGDLTLNWGWAKLPANQGFSTSGSWTFSAGNCWKPVYPNSGAEKAGNGGYPYLKFNYPSGSTTVSTSAISLQNIIEAQWNVSRAFRQVLYASSNAGQLAYQTLLDNGGVGADGSGAVPYPPPDIVLPDIEQLDKMSYEELMAVYYAYLNGLNNTFQHTNIMDPDNINVSTNSFDLLIRGTVYNPSGVQMIANHSVFSLYINLNSLTLRSGENVTLDNPGYIIVWADNETSISGYVGKHGDVKSNSTYLSVGPGWVVHADEMTYNGTAVVNHTLVVDKLITYVPPKLSDISNPPDVVQTDIEWLTGHWFIFGVIVGAILLLFGALSERWILAMVGLAVVLISAYAWSVV